MSSKKSDSFDANFNIPSSNNLTTGEEITIQSVMSDIKNIELLLQNISDPKNIDNDNNNSNKILNNLNSKLQNLEQKKIDINKILLSNIANEKTQIQIKETVINELENKIIELKYKINEFNTIDFNPLIAKKILANNQILSKNEINNILNIFEKKETTDMEQIKFLKSEIQINKNLENNLNNNLSKLNNMVPAWKY